MSIKIHHGPNGSYKTSGAIQDDAVPALKEGRLIITNVRGFTLDRVLQVMPDLPESVDIINLDLELLDDMERMRTWFQWAPRGAFIIFDETQLVFPKAWRERDLERFNFPGGSEAAQAADRPMSWLDGWTRHRHWNWDIVLTTPNIAYIRDDIRMTCEMAYKHSNLAVIGIPGRYKEAQHDAQLNRPPADGTIVEYRKIKPETFKLYSSTATGKTQDTKAGKSLLKSPKLLFLLAFLAVCLIYLSLNGGFTTEIIKGPSSGSAAAGVKPSAPTPVAAQSHPAPPPARRSSDVAGQSHHALAADLNHPFAPLKFVIKAVLKGTVDNRTKHIVYFDLVDAEGKAFHQSNIDLYELGYRIQVRNNCLVEISHMEGFQGQALCPPRERMARRDASPLPAASVISAAPATPSSRSLTPLTVVPDSEYPARPWR